MALPKLKRKYALWAKVESSYGVDPTPTISNSVLCEGVDIKIVPAIIERDDVSLPDLSKCAHLIGKYYAEITFNCYLMGSGDADGDVPPGFGALFKACSMLETVNVGTSVVYTPTSSAQESCTIWCNKDGVMHKINGCVGSWKLAGAVGQMLKLSFAMKGQLGAMPSDVALSVGTSCLAINPPLLLGATFSYGSWSSPLISSFAIDIANATTERDDVTEVSGIAGFFVSDRKPIVQFDPEMVSVASRDVWGNFLNLTESALAMSIGDTPGNTVAIAAPKCVKRAIPYGDRSGINTYALEAALIRTSGDDELSITFT
jgi:hypothetical protein